MEKTLTKSALSTSYYIAVAVAVVVILSWFGFLDIASTDYIDGSIVQATIAFASARALNAVVSVAQSTEVSVMIASFGIGEALDPLNDLVEQYATLMKYAIASLLVQKLLLTITSNIVFKVLLTLIAVLTVGAAFLGKVKYFKFSFKAFTFFAFLRFALVLVVILNGLVSHFFVNEQIESDIRKIQTAAEEVKDVSEGQAIAPGLKAQLESRLQNLAAERAATVAQKDQVNTELSEARKELANAQQDLSALEEGLGLTKKINFLNRDEDHAKAIAKRDETGDELDRLEERLSKFEQAIQKNDEDRIATRNTLEGKANSWLEAIGDATGEMAGGIKKKFTGQISSLVESLNDSVTNMLNLMAAFLLKTLILPLLFLYMVVLLTRAIWNVDLRDHDPTEGRRRREPSVSMKVRHLPLEKLV